MSTIFAELPSELIIRIIREADGGINTHKRKSAEYIADLSKLGRYRDYNFSIKTSLFMASVKYLTW